MDRRERDSDAVTAMQAAMGGWQANIWTALPGAVVSVNLAKQTCTFQPAIRARVQDEKGEFTWVALPVLLDCPLYFPSGGGVTLTFPVKAGDEGLAVIASRCIDGWWQSSGIQNQPDLRMHDLSDGMVYVGFSSVPKVIASITPSAAELRSNDGAAAVSIDPVTHKVTVRTSGAVEVIGGSTITLTAPNVIINGTLTLNGGMTSTTGFVTPADVVAGGKSLKTHVHGGVTTGGANTSTPI